MLRFRALRRLLPTRQTVGGILRKGAGPAPVDVVGPQRLHVGDHVRDLLRRQLVAEGRHAAPKLGAALDNGAGKHAEIVVPGMGGAVQWRRRELAVGVAGLPLGGAGTAFEMAGDAVLSVHGFSRGRLFRGVPAMLRGLRGRQHQQRDGGDESRMHGVFHDDCSVWSAGAPVNHRRAPAW